ncbi:GH15 family glucan-1,4-alpha-glucosidase [Flavobacterium sp. CG_9.10]|uniref:glycoside hydrolase 100 family protein n=1 Tax=Flavobacterium sp. CG_9.10 TaxID=2787729 RepID=UPI0018C8E392|nr:glycoside hydrolase 100 family protein [Flavobacterium sp. CG_9.10]MBG6110504.1 GH15 family glucan-1,4-alpha-glucosidase [Flavobacterium sp. CG_9.10]
MNSDLNYTKAIELLQKVSSSEGFLASAQNISNYKRVWARDGVICGLAALASGDEKLIETFRKTLETLANNQHHNGTIPSNVMTNGDQVEVSYGGLAGRVDAVTWFVIGICQYAYYTKDIAFVAKYDTEIEKCFALLEAWEFNNRGLLYVPLSGNWADEYITDGYVLYDQLLRIWALKSYNHFAHDDLITDKIKAIIEQLEINFTPNSVGEKYHERAYHEVNIQKYMPCSFSPAGYKTQFDAFANSLALYLNIGSEDFQNVVLEYSLALKDGMPLQLLPAFWPPIKESDLDWNLLKNNCKYEFRNYPNEFHNGGSWPMVNGFFGLALLAKEKNDEASRLLNAINKANAVEDFSFYENFNSETKAPNGVPFCAWSAAATVMLHQSINANFKFLV